MRITVVEDNPDLRYELEFLLKHAGYQVSSLAEASALYQYLETGPETDILLLDLGLPDEDGLQVARKVQRPGLGIIMLTARGTLRERVEGLNTGADAYLVKPVDFSELVAVMNSVHRRLRPQTGETGIQPLQPHLQLDPARRNLLLPGAPLLELTAAEGIVLDTLSDQPFIPVSRQALCQSLGHDYLDYDERRLEAIISRLRRKLKQALPDVKCIKAARGVGYQLLLPIEKG
ncbi:MAG: response regulator transcription factor [Endozoicomonas sp.]